jgi:hypothetical protein
VKEVGKKVANELVEHEYIVWGQIFWRDE